MQDQSKRSEGLPGSEEEHQQQMDNLVLECMLVGASWPWSVPELALELESEVDAVDAVNRLQRAGLLHRCGDFVFPTRSARRAAELQTGTL